MDSTAQGLRQLLGQAEREQQEQLSLRAHNAELLAENARLQQTVEEDREESCALRNVIRRGWAEKKELQEKLKWAEQRRDAAVREANLAKIAQAEAMREKRRAEADLAQAEGERDAIIEEIETAAEDRISQAEGEAAQCRYEIRVRATRLRRQRRRCQRTEGERDQLRLEKQADADAIYNLRVENDARPRD